jgi:hypothetical protein
MESYKRGRAYPKISCQTQDFIRGDTDRFVMATALTSFALIGEWAFSLEVVFALI